VIKFQVSFSDPLRKANLSQDAIASILKNFEYEIASRSAYYGVFPALRSSAPEEVVFGFQWNAEGLPLNIFANLLDDLNATARRYGFRSAKASSPQEVTNAA